MQGIERHHATRGAIGVVISHEQDFPFPVQGFQQQIHGFIHALERLRRRQVGKPQIQFRGTGHAALAVDTPQQRMQSRPTSQGPWPGAGPASPGSSRETAENRGERGQVVFDHAIAFRPLKLALQAPGQFRRRQSGGGDRPR